MAVIIDSTAVINAVRLKEQAGDPAAPAASYWLLYAKAAGLFIEDSASAVTGPFGTGGGSSDVVALTLTNQTGGSVSQGDVVYISDLAVGSFDSDTNLGITKGTSTYAVGVVLDATIAGGAAGRVAIFGKVPKINLDGTSALGNFVIPLGSSSQAHMLSEYPSTLRGYPEGVFGYTLDTGTTTPPALIWNPPSRGQEVRYVTVTGVDLNSATDQTLINGISTGQSLLITRFVIRDVSASLTTVSFSIGYNSTAFNDVLADATHTELTGNTLYTVLAAKAGAKIGTGAVVLKLKNNILNGTATTCTVDIYGILLT